MCCFAVPHQLSFFFFPHFFVFPTQGYRRASDCRIQPDANAAQRTPCWGKWYQKYLFVVMIIYTGEYFFFCREIVWLYSGDGCFRRRHTNEKGMVGLLGSHSSRVKFLHGPILCVVLRRDTSAKTIVVFNDGVFGLAFALVLRVPRGKRVDWLYERVPLPLLLQSESKLFPGQPARDRALYCSFTCPEKYQSRHQAKTLQTVAPSSPPLIPVPPTFPLQHA